MTPYEYGKRAFELGMKRVPAWDKEFLETYIAGNKVGEGIEPAKQWLRGWDEANLNEEFEF